MFMRFSNILSLCLLTAISFTAHSAPVPIDSSILSLNSNSESTFGIGVTFSVAQRPFVGVEDQTTSLPYISVRYKDFYIEGTNIGYKIINSDKYHLDFLITPRYFEVQESFASNGELDGIDKTRQTFFAGLTAQYNTDIATYTVQLLTDLSESDGTEINTSASKTIKVTKTFSLSPTLGITLQDEKLVDHFYGVQANEMTINRPLYKGKSTLNYFASLTSLWNISKSIQLIAQIKVETLGKGITDSPIVDEKTITSYVLGTVYRF